jgi:hypothetical protein
MAVEGVMFQLAKFDAARRAIAEARRYKIIQEILRRKEDEK